MGGDHKYEGFGRELKQLIKDMGAPTLENIAAASRRPGREFLSRSRLSDWRAGKTLPSTPGALDTLLTVLTELSGTALPADRRIWHAKREAARKATTQLASPETAPPPRPVQIPASPGGQRVRDADPLLLGVRRAREHEGHEPIPPYVPRDADEKLDVALQRAAEQGGLILLRGDSTAGKTRSAYEAMLRLVPDFRLVQPRRMSPLDEYVEDVVAETTNGHQCVVWLDELEFFLGPDRLDLHMLSRLIGHKAVILSTMRLTEYHRRTAHQDEAKKGDDAYSRIDLTDPVLKAAEIIDLARVWSTSELERTEAESDPRLAEAFRHHTRYGIAEYVSTGPKLWDKWRNARYVGGHPRGHALVAVAIDLVRAGLSSPLPTELLARLHGDYLADEQGALLDPEPFEDALTWASEHHLGISRLLLPVGDALWRPFDYLLDMLAQSPDAPSVPDEIHKAAFEHASSPQELYSVGVAAHHSGHVDLAVQTFTPPAEAGNVDSMLYLGSILLDQGKEGAAEEWWLRAAEAGSGLGMLNLGVRHSRKGRKKKAEKWWRKSLTSGHMEAAVKLAEVHGIRGEDEEAERLWQVALEGEVSHAFFRFGLLAFQRGDHKDAERLYLEGAIRGSRESATNLAQLYVMQNRLEEAEKLYLIAVEAGDAVAMRSLGLIRQWGSSLSAPKQTAEEAMRQIAERMQRVMKEGHEDGWDASAKAAKSWYQRAFENGDVLSMRLLGNLYHKHGKWQKAHKCYRRAAKAGDPASVAYFNQPTLAYATQREFPQPDDEDDAVDEGHRWRLSPRTRCILEAALVTEADMASMVLEQLQSRPISTDDLFIGVFGSLPVQTWEQDVHWRRRMIRAFDDLADDLKNGRVPRPRCTGEEMALHIALESAASIVDDSPDLAAEFTEGIPEQPDDYDWWTCKDLLFEDHDVLLMYEPWMEGIEDPDNSVGQYMRVANLRPNDWFVPFREGDRRDPDRGFRS
ncbi:tetratricopeptide repeat protein [Streptomyces sp. NPDC046261]|uniref:tetratricopeptide repeat protein n=1 Tax=Streptomyces sp. NPDC046261 TaxID=3157200 RepID=UPI0033F5986B